ncbi:MAG: CAP domain-containing protein [Patescibacteria group bacterium]
MFLAYTLAHYFFPRHTNNHKAKLLHSSSLFLLILSLAFYQVALRAIPLSGMKILGYASNIPPSEVISLGNQKRAEAGLSPLTLSPILAEAARAKGEDMLAQNYWAHVAPDGTTPWKFFTDVGYTYRFAGENLARDFSDPVSAMEAWVASPSHRENLLASKYNETGVAVVEGDLGGVETTIIVQFFGTKQSSSALAQVPVAKAVAETQVIPTATPAPLPTAEVITSAPVGASTVESKVLISPFETTKRISFITISTLLIIMVVDGIVIRKRRIARIGGRTFAHLAFLGMILAVVVIAKAGQIL